MVAAQPRYSDVGAANTHHDDIQALAGRGVFEGTDCGPNRFCPDEPISRATMAVWVVRVLDEQDPPPGSSRFPDVNIQLPAFWPPFVDRLADLGVTQGCGDGTNFCPDDPVTRAQMSVFLTRAFDLPDAHDPGFADVGRSYWAYDSIAALAALGITKGCASDRYCPEQPTTRAQMASFLNRAIAHDEAEEPSIEEVEDEGAEEETDSTDQGSAGEEHLLHVYYCGPEGGYDQQRLNEEVQRFNAVISRFYSEQSLGAVDVRFEAAGVVSPDVHWSDEEAHNIGSWHTLRNAAGPCNSLIPNMPPRVPSFDPNEELDLIVVLAHIPPGPRGDPIYGYARPRLGPAVVPTVEKVEEIGRYSSTEHLGIVAHEIGHMLWNFKHPDEQGRTSSHDAGSLMSHGTVLDLSEAYIACYQRQQEGWVDDSCVEHDPAPFPESNSVNGLSLEISWGSDGSGRRLCPANTECRNLSYRYIGDWPNPPYDIECAYDGRAGSRFDWRGTPNTGCIYRLYRGPNLTVQVTIYNVGPEPVRSNILHWNTPTSSSNSFESAMRPDSGPQGHMTAATSVNQHTISINQRMITP